MIRHATPDDFESILDLSGKFWLETLFSEPFERHHTLGMVEQSYAHGLLSVIVVDSEIVGFAAGVKSFLLGSSRALSAVELAWYVDKPHRKGRHGVALLRFMEDAAREQGVKYWSMVSMQSSMPEKINSMYERLGYEKSETTYTKVL